MPEERRDDWNNSVDMRLVNLTSAQKSADIDLDKLHRESIKIDRILRGDPTRRVGSEGLIETINRLQNEINKFNRIFDKDYLGHGGLVSFIAYVYERERSIDNARTAREGYKWAFWGVTLAALIGAAALVFVSKDQIVKWFPIRMSPMEKIINKAEHPKSKHHHYTVHISSQGAIGAVTSP